MGNTADLAIVQKTIIDTLHKESILNAKLPGIKKLGREMCTSNRNDRKLENTVKQSRFKHLGELHKE